MSREPSAIPTLKTRRGELRKTIQRRSRFPVGAILRAPSVGWGLVIWGVFTLVVGSVAAWTREQPLLAVGRVARDTRTVSAKIEVDDKVATEREREKARVQTRRVYVADAAVLEGLRASIESLPKALADAESIDGVEAGIREQFALTPESLAAIKRQAIDGEVSEAWARATRFLGDSLVKRTPLLDPTAYQIENTSPNAEVELRLPAPTPAPPFALSPPSIGPVAYLVSKRDVLSVQSAQLGEDMNVLALRAGFRTPLLEAIVHRLMFEPKPTYAFNSAATTALQDQAASQVEPQKIVYADKQVIVRRGEAVGPEQLDLVIRDQRETMAHTDAWRVWLARLGLVGLVGAVALALAGYTILFCPQIKRNPLRLSAVAGLLALTAGVACLGTVMQPSLVALTAVAPTVFVSVILCIAYERRVALAYASLHAIIVCGALGLSVGWYALLIAGVGAAIWQLREVRERDTFIRMGVLSAGVMACGMMIVGMTDLPIGMRSLRQSAGDAGLAGFAGLLVGGLTLFILPSIERVFDITTGLTLVELRDPKQPLLRELQQRAPGTYNHSLNVASLAEAAADAIGADSLLTYVGALYHDIGKMNKPDYFVENQTPGSNKHDKLNPTMSLLIIVNHVKDGLELAKEFNLPRTLHHFIEAHHGTTLVEYFYQRARRLASSSEGAGEGGDHFHDGPAESLYRYPGPRPRTKECAILMLCDAIESASRTLADPTPSRIDTLVHEIATKRLTDGQFDECDLTLRELSVIVEAVSRTLAAVYHGRIAYTAGGSPNTASSNGGPKTSMMTLPSSGLAAPETGPPQVASAGPKTSIVGRGVGD